MSCLLLFSVVKDTGIFLLVCFPVRKSSRSKERETLKFKTEFLIWCHFKSYPVSPLLDPAPPSGSVYTIPNLQTEIKIKSKINKRNSSS